MNLSTPSPMLARQYTENLRHITYPCFSQPKLDGIRCLMNSRGGWSRQGNPFRTVGHIQEVLEDTFRQCPSLILDGELYSHRLHDNFNAIVSLVKKTSGLSEADFELARAQIEFWIYDIHVRGWDWTFAERYDFLRSLPIAWAYETPIKIVQTVTCTTPEEVDRQYETLLLERFEGQMIRLNGPYEESGDKERRSGSLLKRKPTNTEEFIVAAVNEGEGKCRNMVGSFTCLTKDSRGFEAACKFDFPLRRRMWHDRARLIGQSASVRFQNFTPDGIPRFGRVVAIRNYE